MNKGILYAAGAYAAWGLLPLFWKALQSVPALEILAHRIVWALGLTLLLTAIRGQLRQLGVSLRSPRILLAFGLSAVLLSLNWFIYIWAVNAGHIVETSLGYFINPLANVLLGMLFLNERLRLGQGVAVLIALAGVLYLTFLYGSPPWIALALAGSFAFYGLLRKTASLDSLAGLTLETLLIFPPALIYLLFLETNGAGAFGHTGWDVTLLLAAAGLVTAGPLLLFAAGARRISLTTLGLLQYLAPSLQFTIGVLVYGEPLTPERLTGFALIWLALAIYSGESLLRGAARARAAGVEGR